MFKFDPTPHNNRFLMGARKGKTQHNPIWTVEKHLIIHTSITLKLKKISGQFNMNSKYLHKDYRTNKFFLLFLLSDCQQLNEM
jgi:hypothetical protein